MSKKKRKTRAEKSQPKKYSFKMPTYKRSNLNSDSEVEENVVSKVEIVDPKVIFDLKKVGLIIGVVLIIFSIVAFVIYKTDLLNPVLNKIGVSY